MGSAQSTARIGELLQEDKNAKQKRELCQKQSTLISKLIRQLSVHDNRAAAAAASWSNGAVESGNDGCGDRSPHPSLSPVFACGGSPCMCNWGLNY